MDIFEMEKDGPIIDAAVAELVQFICAWGGFLVAEEAIHARGRVRSIIISVVAL